MTSFVGRRRELVEITRLLAASRLVTLTGPGGSGKTRLAIRVAETMESDFPNKVWLVDLAVIHDPELVLPLVARVLGVHATVGEPLVDTLNGWVAVRELLLVMDNCEHLVDACAGLALSLLSHSERLRILATSREPLAISGESVYPVFGLACPPSRDGAAGRVHEVGNYDAVRLFIERGKAVEPGFSPSPDGEAAVAEICRRLDGLPLALELAGAWVNVLPLQQISYRLGESISLLVSRQRSGVDPRHYSLRAAMDWSHDLLTLPEQVLLRRLSIFGAGFSLAAAEAVCSGEEVDRGSMLGVIASLVNKSLVKAITTVGSEARYNLLETIRQHAREKLMASGEMLVLSDKHLQYYLELAEDTLPKLSGPYQKLWLNWLEGEYVNIRIALAWAVERGQMAGACLEAGLRIAIAIYQFWTIRDYVEEGLGWMERLISLSDERIAPLVRANALAYASFLAGFRGKISEQLEYGRAAAVLAEAAGENGKSALRWALSAQAYGARAAGDFKAEYELGRQVIQLNRELGDSYQLGLTLSITSFSAITLGQYMAARSMLNESMVLLRDSGNPYRIAMALNFMGDLERCERHYPQAKDCYGESIALLRPLDAPRDLASVLQNLGHTCLHLDNVERGYEFFSESLSLQLAQNNMPGIAECLIGYAALAVLRGLPAAGARLLASAVGIGGHRIATAWAATRMEYEHYDAMARARLPETEFLVEQVAGSKLSLEQAVIFAQGLPLQVATVGESGSKSGELTQREREIAALIGQGLTNGEIAGELVLSKRTVEKHIAHIMLKLGATHRAQIVRWAIDRGVVDT